MKRNYELWTEIPYAGESRPPQDPEEPLAGSWSTYFMKQEEPGEFTSLNGRPIHFHIKDPNQIDWEQQLKIVNRTLATITDHQITIARYWGTGPATRQWTPIIDELINTYHVTAPRAAKILADVQAAINDAFVVTWYYKFKWLVARPNQLDQDLVTYVCTPRHPTYISGHAAVAGCAETVLGYFFPSERHKLRKLAEECAVSRLYGGVHFPVDNDEGLRLGRQVGNIAVRELKKQHNSENEPIDTPFQNFRNADLTPPPYDQVIPFDFKDTCKSLIHKDTTRPKEKIKPKPAKPKLFI